jgi:proton-translocating NADH-quinone oxidoreductase chain L
VADFIQSLTPQVWLIPVYPLIAFLTIVFGRWTKVLPQKMSAGLVILATFLGLLHTLAFLSTWGPSYAPLEVNVPWLTAGALTFSLGTLVDATSMMMLLVVTTVSLLIQIYTHGYMKEDPAYARFYAFLALFNFSMLSLVLSTNLFQMYVFWEMVGVSSFLLIGFWFYKPSAAKACVKAFLMNRVGDMGLLIGILTLLYYTWGQWSPVMLSFTGMPQAAQIALQHAGPGLFTVISLLIFMGPMAKSAQLPLHTWLPDAMEGPTPISALIHAATMVAAGVFLVARMYPVFSLSPQAMMIIATIGALTAVVAATIALTQTDIKKALAYSTMSQLGYMMLAMGIGAYTAGLFHLVTHAYFKAMLFLCSGSVIHGCHHEQDMREMGGLAKKMPLTHLTYLIGTIAITGILPFAGFWSKDEIIAASSHHPFFFGVALLTAGMTSFYMFRTYFLTFTGEYRGHAHPHESPFVMTGPLLVLAVPSVFAGLFLSGQFGFMGFGDFIHFGHAHHEAMNLPVVAMSVGVAFAGLLLSYLMYGQKVISASAVASSLKPFYVLFQNKWFFDELYAFLSGRVYLTFASLSSWFDRYILDGLVGLSAGTVSFGGAALRTLQTGRVQLYIMVLSAAAMVLAVYLWNLSL